MFSPLLAAYFISIVIGGALAWLCTTIMGWALAQELGLDRPPHSIWWLVSLIGAAERAIVTSLLIFAPVLTPGFIGGWVLLKFAGGWGRFKEPSVENRSIYMIALLGNVVSLAAAVWGALYVSPDALATFAKVD